VPSPGMTQVCGVMQRASPSLISLVDICSILEQKLTGYQGTLDIKKTEDSGFKTLKWFMVI